MPEPPQLQVVGSGNRRPSQQQDEDSTAHEKFVPANPDCLKKTPPRSAQSAQRLTVRLLEASHEPYGLKQWSLSRLRRPRLVPPHRGPDRLPKRITAGREVTQGVRAARCFARVLAR